MLLHQWGSFPSSQWINSPIEWFHCCDLEGYIVFMFMNILYTCRHVSNVHIVLYEQRVWVGRPRSVSKFQCLQLVPSRSCWNRTMKEVKTKQEHGTTSLVPVFWWTFGCILDCYWWKSIFEFLQCCLRNCIVQQTPLKVWEHVCGGDWKLWVHFSKS